MTARRDYRRFERLAVVQNLACDQRRHELGQSCKATDARVAAEARSLAEHEAVASALETTFAAPRLCVDRLALAIRQFHSSEAAMTNARRLAEAAREAEDVARASLHQASHRAQLVGDIARKLRRKRADKRETEAILQSTAVNASRGDRS